MGLIRLIIFIALIWIVWRLVKHTLASRGISSPGNRPPARARDGEKMVRCEQCGVHVPEGEAFFHKQLSFCSQEHQQVYLEDHRD